MNGLPTIVVVLVAVLFSALGVLGYTLYTLLHGPRARLRRRIQQAIGGAGRPPLVAQPRRRATQARIKPTDERGQWAWALREQLMQAGLRIEVRRYLVTCAGLAAGAAAVSWLVGAPAIAHPLAAAIVGFGIPKVVVGWLAKRRIGRFTSLFSDALDIIVRGMRSGLPLGECITIIGREMPDPLGSEFRLMAEGQKLGLSLQECLERAVERMPTADFRYFTIVLAIQKQTGGNLAETLAKLSDLLRQRKRMRDKIAAYSSEAVASALIIGSLPVVVTLMLLVVGGDYILVLAETEPGHMIIFVGAVLMASGAFVMRKMINFDI